MSVCFNVWGLFQGISHICRRYWKLWREEQDRTDEQDPKHSDIVDGSSPFAKCEWTLDELDLGFV